MQISAVSHIQDFGDACKCSHGDAVPSSGDVVYLEGDMHL
jgi:hypothetical protein